MKLFLGMVLTIGILMGSNWSLREENEFMQKNIRAANHYFAAQRDQLDWSRISRAPGWVKAMDLSVQQDI